MRKKKKGPDIINIATKRKLLSTKSAFAQTIITDIPALKQLFIVNLIKLRKKVIASHRIQDL